MLRPSPRLCLRQKITYNICPPIPRVRIVPFGIPFLGSFPLKSCASFKDGHLMFWHLLEFLSFWRDLLTSGHDEIFFENPWPSDDEEEIRIGRSRFTLGGGGERLRMRNRLFAFLYTYKFTLLPLSTNFSNSPNSPFSETSKLSEFLKIF